MSDRHAADLAKEIAFLRSIPSAAEFQDYVADTFADREPDDIVVEALRSDEIAPRTLIALETIIDGLNAEVRHHDRLPPQKKRQGEAQRLRRRITRFGGERTEIRRIVLRLEEEGRTPKRGGKSNPVRRAEHLAGQILRQPGAVVTHEDWERLVAEEKAKDEAAKKAAKEARREERRQERRDGRAAARGDSPSRNPRQTLSH